MSREIKIYRSTEAPGHPAQGDLLLDTSTATFTEYNGASWAGVGLAGVRAKPYASTNGTTVNFEVPGSAGAPTGVFNVTTGNASIVYDTTNRRLCIRTGGSWFATASLSLL